MKRLPILMDSGAVKYILHESLITGYMTDTKLVLDSNDFKSKNLKDLFDFGKDRKEFASAIAFVSVNADLGTARNKMEAKPHCADVFVTATGLATEPIQGWLTSTLLATVK